MNTTPEQVPEYEAEFTVTRERDAERTFSEEAMDSLRDELIVFVASCVAAEWDRTKIAPSMLSVDVRVRTR